MNRNISRTRFIIQYAIALFFLIIGFRFYLFVRHFETSGTSAFVSRPPSVEAFLPISALVALKSWISTGVFDRIHPAGLSIFLTVLITALLLNKGFCGWLCPIGTASDRLWRLGRRLFGGNVKPNKYVDWALTSLKYLLLYFFIKVIFIGMSGEAAAEFLLTPYNQVADVKMLKFFTDLTTTRFIILASLALLSVAFMNFWCRYLCPYGALLGIIGFISPTRIARSPELCTNCRICDRVCPNQIKVSQVEGVRSPECSLCLECIARCPRKNALQVRVEAPFTARFRLKIAPRAYTAAFLGLFFALIIVAMITGRWNTTLTYDDYMKLIPIIDSLNHP